MRAPSSSSPRTGALLALASALLAATFFIPYKAATSIASVDAIVIAMLLPAAVLNTFTTLANRPGKLSVDRTALRAGAFLAAFTVIGNISATEALSRLDPGMTSLLLQTQVLFVVLTGWMFLRERITARYAIGGVLALMGVAVVRWPSDGQVPVDGIGLLWALGAAFGFGVMHVITRRYIDEIEPVTVNAVRLWLSVAILMMLPGRAAKVLELSGRAWLLAATAAFFGPFLARTCIMYSVRHIQASHAALFTLLTPVFAFPLQLAFLGRAPTAIELLGGSIILAGIAIPAVHLARR